MRDYQTTPTGENDMGEVTMSLLELKPNSKATWFVASAVLLLTGSLITFYSVSGCVQAGRALHWQRVPGDLVSVASHVPGEGPDYMTVQYRYDFGGRPYQGDRICFGAASEGSEKLGRVTTGQKITVFVNPRNPQESVLLPGVGRIAATSLGIGGALVVIGLVVAGGAFYGHATKR
jgi:hypothetical protein